MSCKYSILFLLMPVCTFSQPPPSSETMIFKEKLNEPNSIVHSFSNESEEQSPNQPFERTIDHPTQIIRMSAHLENQPFNCDQVNETIEKTLIQHITGDKFTFNFYIVCRYNPETTLATEFIINSYFDPIDDKAVEFLKTYLAEYNGADFLGTKLNIESAKGVVVALNIKAGVKKNPKTPPFVEYRQDRSNFYFKNNYDIRKNFLTEVQNSFLTNDPNKVFPFLNKWFYPSASNVYKAVLRDSNYTELQPEKIFLMENGDKLFVSDLKYYFAHDCNKYENHKCLQQGV